MKTIKYLGLDCVPLADKNISILVTQSVGPRIISLRFNNCDNLFAELPEFGLDCPDGGIYHFYGGHRFWHAPEEFPQTYLPDDKPIDIRPIKNGLLATQLAEDSTGLQKSLEISLSGEKSQIIIKHILTNCSSRGIKKTAWAITQLKPGGIAILPFSQEKTNLQPNRTFTIWPYTDMTTKHVRWGNHYILVTAKMQKPFKVGFPNPRGWMGYWLNGTLFVKRSNFDLLATYCDLGSSSECYCNDQFLELETLAPITEISPGDSITHIENWKLYENIDFPSDEEKMTTIVNDLRLENNQNDLFSWN